jgi:membrane protein
LLSLLGSTFMEWTKDNAPRLGASLSYYTALSIAPLLIVVIAIAGFVFGEEAARGQLFYQLRAFLGVEGAKAIEGMIEGARKPAAGTIATILGVLTLAWGSSAVVAELKDALNTIWKVSPPQGRTGLWSLLDMVRVRFFSFGLVLAIGFLLLVSLVLSAGLEALGNWFGRWWPIPPEFLLTVNFLVSFLVITILFAMIFKILPDIRIAWGDVVMGAAATSLLFSIGKTAIGWYLGQNSYSSTYGAVGSLVVVLVWVYYSAQIFFLGAEFTKVYAAAHGSKRAKKDREHLVDAETLKNAELTQS